ncbi:MAG TPA: glycosyltransferase family 1 protein [Holosporales bacterium]|nr:glycosyltransferase family 1 protein [Holosporales bacterium]
MRSGNIRPMTKLLYLVTEADYFFSHRYALAKAAQQQGYEVSVATVPGTHRQRLLDEGFRLYPLTKMTRAGLHPLKQFLSFLEIYKIYRTEKPDMVHHVAMKPVLYGTLAARLAGVKCVVNALTGLGYLFISPSVKAKFLRFWVWTSFRFLFKGPKCVLILQNKDDFQLFSKTVPPQNLALIRGSGVDIKHFSPPPKKKDHKRLKVVLVARLLWDKGIREAIEVVRLLKEKGFSFEFILAGGLDLQNPSGIPRHIVEQWQQQGLCTWMGKVDDVAKLYQACDIAVLPSYREGLPKSLLEAAACGLPIVTTDVPGCREIVEDGKTGLLVPVRTVGPLTEALGRLLTDAPLRKKLGHNARTSVEKNFSSEKIIKETVAVYEVLEPRVGVKRK